MLGSNKRLSASSLCFAILAIASLAAAIPAEKTEGSGDKGEIKPKWIGKPCNSFSDCPGSTEYCDYYSNTCQDLYEDYDDAVGLAVGVLVAICIGVPLVITVSIILCCCFCPGCPLRNRRDRRNNPTTIIMQQPPAYVYANPGMMPPGQQVPQAGQYYGAQPQYPAPAQDQGRGQDNPSAGWNDPNQRH